METISFKIEHMDLLGQGVSKEERIVFIEKTLPGETGTAEIYRKAKGVIFGRLTNPKNLDSISQDRKDPECPHFYNCRGCQYLHTSYEKELNFKKESLEQLFERIRKGNNKIVVHPAKQRFNYRNRMQLHYNTKPGELGLVSTFHNKLINASQCLLPMEQVEKAIKNLYKNDSWMDLLGKADINVLGYIEVYLKPGDSFPDITVNRKYATGGFTQIYNDMGDVLRELVTSRYLKYVNTSATTLVLDIFGGNGNLSDNFSNTIVKVYDLYPSLQKINTDPGRKFINIDLYKKNPVNQIKSSLKGLNIQKPNLIIVDPPRAGVKYIESYIGELAPPFLFYISCDPATLKRDTLKIIDKYSIIEIHLIDLFPGTRHFETFVIFKKKRQK